MACCCPSKSTPHTYLCQGRHISKDHTKEHSYPLACCCVQLSEYTLAGWEGKLFNPSVPSWGRYRSHLLQGSPLLLSLRFLTLQHRGVWNDSTPLWLAPGQCKIHCLWWFPHTLNGLWICVPQETRIFWTQTAPVIFICLQGRICGFSGGVVVKNSPANAGDTRDSVSIPG